MHDTDPESRAREMMSIVETLLDFAEAQDDTLLAAKLEDVRSVIIEVYLTVEI